MSERKFLVLSLSVNLLAIFHIVLIQIFDMYQFRRSIIHGVMVALTLGLMLMVLMIALRVYIVARKEQMPHKSKWYAFNILSAVFINTVVIYFNIIIFFNHINTVLRYFIDS